MIGIDIGTRYIKISCIEKNEDGYLLSKAVMAERQMACPEEESAVLTETLRQLLRSGNFPLEKAVASFGDGRVMARNFTMPDLHGSALDNAIKFEAEQTILSAMPSRCYSDYQLLPSDEVNKKEVLFVTMPAAAADERFQTIEKAGRELAAVNIDALALVNAFLKLAPKETRKESVIIADIGHSWTNFAAVEGGKLRIIKNVAFGGGMISEKISGMYGISTELANNLQRYPEYWTRAGLNIKTILRLSAPPLIEAIYRMVEYCMSKKIMLSVDKIILCGGTSKLHGLDSFITEVLGIKTAFWDPFTDIKLPVDFRSYLGRFFAVSLGLALYEPPADSDKALDETTAGA